MAIGSRWGHLRPAEGTPRMSSYQHRLALLLALTVGLLAAALVLAGSGGASFPGRDGRIVFEDVRADQPGEGNSQIYALDLASGRSRNLAPSIVHDDFGIALSRDGTRIAFVRRASSAARLGELWSMRSDGRTQRRLVASLDDPRDLAWSPDGTKIAFLTTSAPTGTSSLWVVDADGGGLRELTNFWAQDPAWSPDGSELAFAGRADAAVQQALHVGVIDASGAGLRWLTPTPAANDFLHSESAPSWSPDGTELAFVRGNALVVIGADGSGERTLTAETSDTGWPVLLNSAQWSPRGDEIGFVDEDRRLEVVHPDGTGLRTLAAAAGGYGWSPGGDRLVYVQAVPDRGRAVLVVESLSGTARSFGVQSIGWGTVLPVWSAGGKSLFFTDVRAGVDFELSSIGPRGGGLRQLTRNSVDDFDPAFSPDGRRIAFARGNYADGPSSLYLMDANGGHLRRLTRSTGMDTSPSWAPDDAHIVFARGGSAKVPYPGIDILDTRTGLEDPLHVQPLVGAGAVDPAWSPDGRLIAFISYGTRHTRLMVVRPDGLDARTLYTAAVDDAVGLPSWSPDGRSIAFALGSLGGSDLVVSRKGGRPRSLSCPFPDGTARALGRLSWSPDGTAIAVEHAGAIWVCPLNGSRPHRLATGSEPDWQPLH